MSNRAASTVAFLPARAKLWIGSLDVPTLEVRAQYNPRELQIEKSIPWQDHKLRASPNPEANPSKQDDVELNSAPKRSMTLELLFDTYELAGNESVPAEARTVAWDVRALEDMSSVMNPKDSPDLRRPHHCVVAWGNSTTGMRPFRCVIESLTVKYTMFDHGGAPVRATCTVQLKEADKMDHHPVMEYGEKRRGTNVPRVRDSSGTLRDYGLSLRKMQEAQDRLSNEQYTELAARRRSSSGRPGR
jgi:hypothetical protein